MVETSSSKFFLFKWPILCYVGIIAVFQYIFFSFLAFLVFPESFDPFNNFLSQLGNYDINPDGAIFYFLAIIFSGILTVLFYWGFYSHFSEEKPVLVLKVVLILGVANGFSIFMSGIFAESVNYPLHFIFSFSIFFTLLPLLILINVYLWKTQNYTMFISLLGFTVAVIDFIFVCSN